MIPFFRPLGLSFVFLSLILLGQQAYTRPLRTIPPAEALVTINATHPGQIISGRLWGSNLMYTAPSTQTVADPDFVQATRQIGVRLIRWPGGNISDAYDWKRDEVIKPGYRQADPDGINLTRLLQFIHDIDGELIITINFGTMNAQDAADLVAFLNGPADSPWGARRAALGFPQPLDVRFFEIGNEEIQPHMWYYSWTAENREKYFFGGEEERRKFYDNRSSQAYDPVGAKGDFFAAQGGPNQSYWLRFPPVRDVQVFWARNRDEAEQHIFSEWQEVTDLSGQPPDAQVFTLEPDKGILHFGDGVHGAMPPAGSYFLVEYTTYGHQGFVDFARAMRAAPSSVPIQVGAAMLPFVADEPFFTQPRMLEIFSEMDFYVRHQYNASFDYSTYKHRRQIATERFALLGQERLQQYLQSIGLDKTVGVAVTEWNIFLDSRAWAINRTLEGGVIAAEWFARVLNAGDDIALVNAAQFALHGGNLALIRSQTNGSIDPMGYVFQGFASWRGKRTLPVSVDSPGAIAFDQEVPWLTATAALSPDGQTMVVSLVNNAETTAVGAQLRIKGFTAARARLWRLTAPSYTANNDYDPTVITLVEEPLTAVPDSVNLPPHSVAFLEFHTSPTLYLPLLVRQ